MCSPSQTPAEVYSVRINHSDQAVGKGLCCSAGSAGEENNTTGAQSEAGEAASLAANCTGVRSLGDGAACSRQ